MFSIETPAVMFIADAFRQDMSVGLAGGMSSLKMLPSYLGKPTGQETGRFLAVDFGGTNIRLLIVNLEGRGYFRVECFQTLPLKDPAGGYDFTAASVTGQELFDFLASRIGEMVTGDHTWLLGHTFSFPSCQMDINRAILLKWTKEIKTSQVEGHDINRLLAEALQRHGLTTVKPVAVINDTVGTLLTAAYVQPQVDIASICGTGHNTCYLEAGAPDQSKPMIFNMESGNFNRVPINVYDGRLDRASDRPGEQRLEKMVAGRYLGELLRMIACDLIKNRLLCTQEAGDAVLFDQPWCVNAKHISQILADDAPACGFRDISRADLTVLRSAAAMLTTRSARLVAASFLGVLTNIDPGFTAPHTIAIDGSLYEGTPGYAATIRATLDEVLGDKAELVKVSLVKDGSGIGAAIAAAMNQ